MGFLTVEGGKKKKDFEHLGGTGEACTKFAGHEGY